MLIFITFLYLSFNYVVAIKGGESAKDLIPHMASLQMERTHLCGGAILSSKWIVTSAFCTQSYDNKPSLLTVVVGIYHVYEKGQSFQADKIIIHDQYYNINNDISLVRINGEIKFNKHVAAIKLPETEAKAGTKAMVAGYGSDQHYGDNLNILQMLNMTTLSLEKCNSIYKERRRPLKKEQLCAVGVKQDASVCKGDNGGPLYTGSNLVGIVSSTNSCGRNRPSIFTNVYYYNEWIKENMK